MKTAYAIFISGTIYHKSFHSEQEAKNHLLEQGTLFPELITVKELPVLTIEGMQEVVAVYGPAECTVIQEGIDNHVQMNEIYRQLLVASQVAIDYAREDQGYYDDLSHSIINGLPIEFYADYLLCQKQGLEAAIDSVEEVKEDLQERFT